MLKNAGVELSWTRAGTLPGLYLYAMRRTKTVEEMLHEYAYLFQYVSRRALAFVPTLQQAADIEQKVGVKFPGICYTVRVDGLVVSATCG